MKILITGANGHLGTSLIRRINAEACHEVVAIVRSDKAAASLESEGLQADIRVVNYTDATGLAEAGRGAEVVIHLAGIIKESAQNTFEMAHEETAAALVQSGLGVRHMVTLGILGTDRESANRCFSSRARSEAILQSGKTPVSVIRVPMVLGPDDYASRALARDGKSSLVFTFRASSLEQPIDSRDVVNALLAAISMPPENRLIELAGPESLTRRALIKRAGERFGNSPLVVSLPIWLGYALAWVFETVSSSPPVTRAMLGVLDHDDRIDPAAAAGMLGLTLTPLDETLGAVL